jgi:hypothetical protein
MVTLVAAAAHLIEPTPGMLLAVVLGFLVALVGAAALRRAGAVAVAARVVSAGCAFCGAHFPAPAGAALRCPFCFTSLVPGARLLSGQEHASATALHAQRSELGAAHAAFSRKNTRTLVAMLLVIGVPLVIFSIYALVLTVRMYAGMK